MAEASLAAQRLAVTAMRAHAPLMALVPSTSIMDRNSRPEIFPSIVVGEAQTVADEADCVIGSEVFLTIHAWAKSNTMTEVKVMAGEIRRALRDVSGVQDGFALDFSFEDSRFLRDPNPEISHAVVTFVASAEDIVGVV